MASTDKRILWIDMARGICMMAILLFHTECYYCGEEIIPYVVFAGNAAITFFFVSGYLFVRPDAEFSIKRKTRSIVTGLVVPYFIFTSVISLPKTFAHDDLTIQDAFLNIITGHATWFVPALIVTQLLFMLMMRLCKGREQWMAVSCALPFVAVALLHHYIDDEVLSSHNLWCWQNAFFMLFFFYMGHVMRQRKEMVALLRRNSVLTLLAVIVVEMKIMEYRAGISLTVEPIHVSSFTLLLIDGLLFSLLVCAICLRLPRIAPIEWTGANSLYYYFICGGVPLMVGKALDWCHLPYDNHIWRLILAFVIVHIAATAIVWMLNLVKTRR